MATLVSQQEAPAGYADFSPAATYRSGFVFEWSSHLEMWLDCQQLVTIRPGETAAAAYSREYGESPRMMQYRNRAVFVSIFNS